MGRQKDLRIFRGLGGRGWRRGLTGREVEVFFFFFSKQENNFTGNQGKSGNDICVGAVNG